MCKFRTLEADEIECRVGRCTSVGAQILLYKDARCDMNILDETVGPMNWRRTHSRDNANCTVSIWDSEKKQWISKEDTGTESQAEAEKGLASDSFKRACVNFGIGRELYTAPYIWIKSCTEKNDKGKWVCSKRFKVAKIEYDNKRRIIALELTDDKGKTVYTMGSRKPGGITTDPEAKPETKRDPIQRDDIMFRCELCGKVLQPYIGNNGKEIGLRQHCNGSMKRFGHVYCLDCIALVGKSEKSPTDEG